MIDVHSHILPGVDDGAPDLAASLAMLEGARAAGVGEIVCTPHVRDPWFDHERMLAAFGELSAAAGGFALHMGFEVNHAKLMELGVEEWGPRLGCADTGQFLLELDGGFTADDLPACERTVYLLQGMGWRVVIAHPERCAAVRRDLRVAERLAGLGCDLQVSADFLRGGRLGNSRRAAKRILKAGLCRYIASDAHEPEHYALLARAMGSYGRFLRAAG